MLENQIPTRPSTLATLASPIVSNPDAHTVTNPAPTPADPVPLSPTSQPHRAVGPLPPEFWRPSPLTAVGIDSLSVRWPERIADNFDRLQDFVEAFELLIWTDLGPPIGSEPAAWQSQTTTWPFGATLTRSPLGGRLVIPRDAADQLDVHTMLGFVRIAMSNPLATIDGLEVSADLKNCPDLPDLVRRSCEAGHLAPMKTWSEALIAGQNGQGPGTRLELGAESASLRVELAPSGRFRGALTWRARYRNNRAAELGRRLAASHTAFPDLRRVLATAVDFDERAQGARHAHQPEFARRLRREIVTATERPPLPGILFWENRMPPIAG